MPRQSANSVTRDSWKEVEDQGCQNDDGRRRVVNLQHGEAGCSKAEHYDHGRRVDNLRHDKYPFGRVCRVISVELWLCFCCSIYCGNYSGMRFCVAKLWMYRLNLRHIN
jgi:hypothetical protein